MTCKFLGIRAAHLFGGLAIALCAGQALADIPDNLTDIPYQSTEWGGDQLRMRGYTLIDSRYRDGKSYEYWWQASSNTCIQARAGGGRYEALKVTGGTDCNQYHKQATANDNAAAIAVGAAAIIGAAVLAHKSHERDEKHGNDSKSVAEFDRGYRDGLYHQPYHNYQNTGAYSDGYNSGVRERHEQTRYRPHDGRYSGYHPYVSVDDLVGASAASADSALRSRGFRDTGGYRQGGKSFVTWYNPGTRQCVQAVTKNGRIKHLDGINEGNCT
jgi:hypothetical protein